MKPRINLFASGLWHCVGGGIRGRGDNPVRAYADWFYEYTWVQSFMESRLNANKP
jgi:hypothetical protein